MNVGEKYSGNYYVESVEHRLSTTEGYICTLKLWRNALGKIGGEIINKVDANTMSLSKNKTTVIPQPDGSQQFITLPETDD